jgi:hypothetical protein
MRETRLAFDRRISLELLSKMTFKPYPTNETQFLRGFSREQHSNGIQI